MQIFLTMFLTNLLVPIILSLFAFKSQSSKSDSPYTFKYPMFLALFFLIGLLMIVALCVGAYLQAYLKGEEVQLELQIFIGSSYTILALAVVWQLFRTLNFKLVLEEDFILYRNLFRITRIIRYEEISRIREYKDKSNNVIKYKIYIGDTRIVIEYFTSNFNDFPKIMKKRLKKVRNNVKFD